MTPAWHRKKSKYGSDVGIIRQQDFPLFHLFFIFRPLRIPPLRWRAISPRPHVPSAASRLHAAPRCEARLALASRRETSDSMLDRRPGSVAICVCLGAALRFHLAAIVGARAPASRINLPSVPSQRSNIMSRVPRHGKPRVQRSEPIQRVGAMSLPSRRDFLKRSALAGALASGYFTSRAVADSRSPNEKLNIGTIGTANQARFSMNGVKSENLVAICDVDDHFLDKAAQDYPDAKKYNDWRKLLEQKDLDAVIVATPDHMHALATIRALRLGKHVYSEKPLTHTVAEARLVAQEAAKTKLATQMGTQTHAGNNYRRVVEVLRCRRDRPCGRDPRLGQPRLPRRHQSAPARPRGSRLDALGPVAGPGPRAGLQPRLLPLHLAAMVGLWQRRHGRHGLPPH